MEAMKQITKISLVWELFEQQVPKSHIAKQVAVSRDTVHEWIRGIQTHPSGLLGFLNVYEDAKKGERAKRKVDGLLKSRIYRLREKNRQCCGQKIQEYLSSEFGIHLSTTTIYEIL